MQKIERLQKNRELLTENEIAITFIINGLLSIFGCENKALELNERLLNTVKQLELFKFFVPHNLIELKLLETRPFINTASTNKANQFVRELEFKVIRLKLTEQKFQSTMFLATIYSKQFGRNQVCG
jgi:hypothetical protein